MALKPDRQVIIDNISYFMFATGERGGVVCATTGTLLTGPAMDSTRRRVEYASTPSGRAPVGLLLSDVVNIDQSRQQLNRYKPNEVQIGSKVTLVRKGTVVTNSLVGGQGTGIQCPATAYLGPSGLLCSAAGFAASGFPVVGKFLTAADSDGYAEVDIDL